jgi:predicted nucleic acid-binding protein
MYETATIPGMVLDELEHPDAPTVVREWAQQRPTWLQVRRVSGAMNATALRHLDAGEREAIELAASNPNSLLLTMLPVVTPRPVLEFRSRALSEFCVQHP